MYGYDMNHKCLGAMVGCWVLTGVLWACAWYSDWASALFSMLANGYFLLSLVFWWNLYPENPRRD